MPIDRLQLAAIVESSDDAIIGKTPEGVITSWNQGAERIYGYTKKEVLGKPITVLLPQDKTDEFPKFMEQIKRGDRIDHYETQRQCKDGTIIDVSLTLSPIKDDSGKVIGCSSVARDITEHKKLDRFRMAVEAAPSAMLMVESRGRITMVNRQVETLFGYRREELVGQSVELLVPERFRPRHPVHRDAFFRGPEARAMGAGRDLFGRRKDGTEVPIEIGLNPIETPEGLVTLASIIDITERKRAEERFRQVVESAPNAMIMVDRKGKITLVNRQAESLFGYTREDLIGKTIEQLVPERFRGHHPGHRDSFFGDPKARSMGAGRDLFGLRKDGSEVPIEIGLNPIETQEGIFTLASIIDITERKRAEERLRLVVEAAPNAMLMVGREGKIVLVNKQMETLFGYVREELIGAKMEMLVPQRFRPKHPGYRDAFFVDPKARAMGAGRDLFGLRKDGSEVPIEIGLNPIETAEGMFTLASIIDITERKRAQIEEIERKNRELEALLHVASHDLKEPLRAISNFSDILYEQYQEQVDEKGRDYLLRIYRASARMSHLIDDLVLLSQSRKFVPPQEFIEGELIVDEAIERLKPVIEKTRAKVKIAGKLPRLRAERTWATQAVYNLIGNALKFTRPGVLPEIEIAPYEPALNESPQAGLVVKDRGPGVAPEHCKRIFELFQRAVGREVEGTGAGLAIVRSVAQRHGGNTWVRHREGGGSEFIITFGKG